MRKRWFLVGMMFLLLPWLLVGCGVAQELYDAVVAERDSLVADLQSFQGELDAAKLKVQSVQSELEALKLELGSASSELESATAELETAKSELGSIESKLTTKESELQSVQSELETVKLELEETLTQLIEAQAPVAPPPPEVEGQTYTNSEYGFSCDFPKDWDVEEGIGGLTVMFAGPVEGEYDYLVNINVIVDELLIRMELDEYIGLSDLQIRRQFPSYTVVQQYETTVGGVTAIVQVITIDAIDSGGYPIKDAVATIIKGKTIYQITLDVTEDLYEKYRDEFALVISTFKFE